MTKQEKQIRTCSRIMKWVFSIEIFKMNFTSVLKGDLKLRDIPTLSAYRVAISKSAGRAFKDWFFKKQLTIEEFSKDVVNYIKEFLFWFFDDGNLDYYIDSIPEEGS